MSAMETSYTPADPATEQKRFDRIEKKYLLDQSRYDRLMDRLQGRIEPDEYFRTDIRNVYMDTETYDIIERSMERPVFKEKMRVRAYDGDRAFVEIKRKYKQEVYKRRVCMRRDEARALVRHGTPPSPKSPVDRQILREIAYFMDFYGCSPKMYIAYDRLAYRGTTDRRLRMTFDTNVRWRASDISLDDNGDERCIIGRSRVIRDQDGRDLQDIRYIMEIKEYGGMPVWLADILDEEQIFSASFSKYGNCYLDMIRVAQHQS